MEKMGILERTFFLIAYRPHMALWYSTPQLDSISAFFPLMDKTLQPPPSLSHQPPAILCQNKPQIINKNKHLGISFSYLLTFLLTFRHTRIEPESKNKNKNKGLLKRKERELAEEKKEKKKRG